MKCILVLCLVALGVMGMAQEESRAAGLFRCQVHRGGGKDTLPDNSLESFLWSWGQGLAPEADARLTRDGVAIALHDDTLKRVARNIPEEMQTRRIATMDWAELVDVDVGSYLGKEYASYRIARMEAVFAAMQGRPKRILYLDEKGAPPEMMAEMSARFGVQEQVYYTSSKYELLPRWKELAPCGKTMLWMGSWSKNNTPEEIARTEKMLDAKLQNLESKKFNGVDQVQIHVRVDFKRDDPFCPSSTFLKKAGELLHKYGLTYQVITWTEGKNPETYKRLWALGVDSFATDYPVELLQVIPELK